MKTSVNMLLMIAIPASIGMMCTSDILILLFSGAEFIGGSLAAKILSAKVVVAAINRILAYQVCTPYKKDKEVLVSTILGAVFNLIANAVLIPLFGVNGAAIATLGSEVVVFIVLSWYSRQVFEMKSLYSRLPIYLVLSAGFFAVRAAVDHLVIGTLFRLTATVGISALGYFGILLLMKDPYLCTFMKGFIERFKRKIKRG